MKREQATYRRSLCGDYWLVKVIREDRTLWGSFLLTVRDHTEFEIVELVAALNTADLLKADDAVLKSPPPKVE